MDMEDDLQVLSQEVRGEGEEASTNNPMLIDSILSSMFEFLDFEDLGQCRSVCKQWHKGSTPTWLAKGPPLKLSLDPNSVVGITMSEFLAWVHNESHSSYGPFELAGLRQYKKFEVVGDATHPDQHEDLLRFLRICGHDLTELKLKLYIPDFDTYLALMLSPMSPNLVKLRADLRFYDKVVLGEGRTFELLGEEHRALTSLQIYCHPSGACDLAKLSESGWIQLLKRYPNLKSLLLIDKWAPRKSAGCYARNPWFDGVLETLLPLFRAGQLSLETLEMSLGPRTSPETIVELLASQAGTLKKLSLQRRFPLANCIPPELPLVGSLELLGRPILDLAALSRFPALKSLSLAYYKLKGFLSLSEQLVQMLRDTRQGCILPTVSTLHCDYGRVDLVVNPLGPGEMRQLAQLFPNLEDLQIWLTNESLGAVLQSWPGLQRLTIIGNEVNDEGISGIVPHLSRMQDLKSFVMTQFKGPTALSEKSLLQFLNLPNLERLEISIGEQLSVSPAILHELEGKIKTVKINRE